MSTTKMGGVKVRSWSLQVSFTLSGATYASSSGVTTQKIPYLDVRRRNHELSSDQSFSVSPANLSMAIFTLIEHQVFGIVKDTKALHVSHTSSSPKPYDTPSANHRPDMPRTQNDTQRHTDNHSLKLCEHICPDQTQ